MLVNNSAQITWNAVQAADIKEYELAVAAVGAVLPPGGTDAALKTITVQAGTLVATLSQLTTSPNRPDDDYQLQIRAIDNGGNKGPWSTAVLFSLDNTAPGQVGGVLISP